MTRINHRIRVREVRTIDADGKQLGVLPTREALALARKQNLDLVEVAATAKPPVCKIMDYGKFRYEQTKKTKEARKNQTATRVKEIKFHANIDEHDYQTKLKKAQDFLSGAVKVKCNLLLRGRERAHSDIGMALMQRFMNDLTDVAIAEMRPKMIGRSIHMMLGPIVGKPKSEKPERNEAQEAEVSESAEAGSEAGTRSGPAALNYRQPRALTNAPKRPSAPSE
ncbi:MAG TPA: translation initiation factor IF-3 [Verrucomicrobia bacterium]|jgi:translation initiation factor IF-3|nr:translation initiation factor IF-3 [Verrucomicrobiota bacterium]